MMNRICWDTELLAEVPNTHTNFRRLAAQKCEEIESGEFDFVYEINAEFFIVSLESLTKQNRTRNKIKLENRNPQMAYGSQLEMAFKSLRALIYVTS